jgi:hypothetical protein
VVTPQSSGLQGYYLLVILIPIFNRGQTRYLFEHIPKRLRVGIAHVEHDFGDVFSARFKTPLCRFNPHALDVFNHRIIGRFFERTLNWQEV